MAFAPTAPMHAPIVTSLESLATWRGEIDHDLASFVRLLADHELVDEGGQGQAAALRERLGGDRLVLAFVAEFSRGKSELINAIFFADTGRRVLPASPGRTTMCPVELAWDAQRPPQLALLPIESRLGGVPLADLRRHDEAWQVVPLDPADPEALAAALAAVTRTQRVDVATARALGFWNPEQPEDNPLPDAAGLVEVPAWRHALINYPHPLLRRGLVVVDTPGLNAIGAEPELTVGLLPSAHAVVFVLAADTGVTRSDLAMWRDHLSACRLEPFVVLNKIDVLDDPLLPPAEVAAQIERQRGDTARILEVPAQRVFPLSARSALAARISGDAAQMARSRLPALEHALAAELMPRHRELLANAAVDAVERLRAVAARRVADRRRQNAEQMLELRGLRGKSAAKVRLMLQRVEAEASEFERCAARIAALRSVQARLLRTALDQLSTDALRLQVEAMAEATRGRPFQLGIRKAFAALCERLAGTLGRAAATVDELRQMLDASFSRLNAEFGFAFVLAPAPQFAHLRDDLAAVERDFARYLSMSQVWRLASPGFSEQFRRLLLARLRVIFEGASAELDLWARAATAQIDLQLRERRRGFRRRHEALERIQAAAGDLERRIGEVEAGDARLGELLSRVDAAAAALVERSRATPAEAPAAGVLHQDAA